MKGRQIDRPCPKQSNVSGAMGAREEYGPRWTVLGQGVEGCFPKEMIPGLRLDNCEGLLGGEVAGLDFLLQRGSTLRLGG